MYEEKFGGSRWSFSWFCQKVNTTVAGVVLTGGDDFGPQENLAQLPSCFGLVISVTDLTCKIYSVLASNGLAFTLRVCYSCIYHQRDAKFN